VRYDKGLQSSPRKARTRRAPPERDPGGARTWHWGPAAKAHQSILKSVYNRRNAMPRPAAAARTILPIDCWFIDSSNAHPHPK
jgi:hypothetical protein